MPKRFLLLFVLSLQFTSLLAQKQYKVFDWKSEFTLNTYLLQEMRKQYAERKANLSGALTSVQTLKAYRDSSRSHYRKLIGALPEKKALNALTVGIIPQGNYNIEKIIYESLPGHHVTGNLYIPKSKGPVPAVLLFCGHEAEAKATESYQKTAILFALNGFVVFVVDPISQGERFQLLNKKGEPITRGGTTEHTLINAAANLVGSSAVAYELWDNIRALDYLESRKEVDPDRMGCLGNSGGGTQVSYFVGFDDRIKAAAACSSIASRERNFELTGANDGCQHIIAEGQQQLEIADFLIMFSPRPMLILAGRYDFVDYKGTLIAFEELQRVYSVFQKNPQLKLFTADDGHGISAPKREAAVEWFRQWLAPQAVVVKENNLKTLSREMLQCTGSGQVNSSYPGELNDIELSRKKADTFSEIRSRPSADLVSRVSHALSIRVSKKSVTAEEVGTVTTGTNTFQKVILRKEGNIPVPVLQIFPENISEVVVWFHDGGKHKIADSTQLINQYLLQRKALVLVDLSGMGETADPLSLNDPKYFNVEYRNAMLALHTGQSLMSLRVTEIITVLDYIKTMTELSGKSIHVFASGKASLPALHAAIIDNRIEQIDISDTLRSFYDLFYDPARSDWYSYVIPGVLKYYDLPELEKTLGTRLKKTGK